MNKNLIETLTGAFVLIVASWFLMFFMENNTGVSVSKNHYNLIAKFEQADGIPVGTPVRILMMILKFLLIQLQKFLVKA